MSSGGLVLEVPGRYKDVSFNAGGGWMLGTEKQKKEEVGKGKGSDVCGWMPGTEQQKKELGSFVDVGEWRLRRQRQMEAIRMRSLDIIYRLWDSNDLKSVQPPLSLETTMLAADTLSLANTLSLETMKLAGFSSTLADVFEEIWSEDVNLQLHATTQIDSLLSIERQCSTTLLKNGVVRRFVHFLMRTNSPDLQAEAAWAIIKIFCGTCGNTKAEAVHQAVPCFVRLLDSPIGKVCDDVCEMAVFALGIVADDCCKYRDLVLSNGVLVPLLKHLKKHAELGKHANFSMLRNITWTLSILCEDISNRFYGQVQPALTTFKGLLHSDDVEVLINSCWSIYHVTLDFHFRIDPLMDAGLCPPLVKHILHTSRRVQIPVLLILTLIPFEIDHIQALINNGAFELVRTLLTQDHNDNCSVVGYYRLKMEACRVITGILRGKEHHIQAVIDADLFSDLLKLLESPDMSVRLEAATAISNATSRASPDQIKYLVDAYKMINPICNLLSSPIPAFAKFGLSILNDVLEAGETSNQYLGDGSSSDVCMDPPNNPYIELINKTGCVEKIEEIWKDDVSGFHYEVNDLARTVLCLMGLIEDYYSLDIDLDESLSY